MKPGPMPAHCTAMRVRRAATILMAAIMTAAACGEAPPAAENGSIPEREWRVSEAPSLRIGVVEGAVYDQLHMVTGAARLPQGGVAVLNAGSHQLRIYDADGRFVSASGSMGAGPGEFRRPVRLYRLADTLAVLDAGTSRLSVFTLDGEYRDGVQMTPAPGRAALDEWLFTRTWVVGPPLGRGRGALRAGLDRLPPPDTMEGYRYVRVSPFGHLWVRQPAAPGATVREWHVYDAAGEPLARAAVPASLEIMEIGADYLLGRARDDMDVEYVQLHALDADGTAMTPVTFAADTTPPPAANEAAEAVLMELRGALRELNMQQEIHYSAPANRYRYAAAMQELTGYTVPEGLLMHVVEATERGWTAVAIHRATGTMCGIGIGVNAPVGWTPGMVVCM